MASNKGTAFKPIRGTEEKIFAIPCSANTEGQIYFATDTGSVYMDYHGKRISIGGHGVAVFYANEAAVQNSADDYYSISRDSVVDPQSAIKVDDLIMNTKDGGFYRVDELTEDFISCERIAVSGSDGGDGGKSLTTEAHGGNGSQILCGAELGGGMTQKGGFGILGSHAAAVVGDTQKGHAAVPDFHGDLGGSGIHGIFQKLLHNAGGTLHHLTGGN